MIEIADLAFRWRSEGPDVLNIAQFSVADGEKVFLQGPSGSGKTSLLNLLGGITLPQRGRISIAGQELPALSGAGRDRFRADHLGMIFQVFNLVPYLSLLENVALPCLFSAHRRQRAIEAAGSVQAAAARLLQETGLPHDRFGDQPVQELSAGQQQRAAAARALVGQPDLVIADEPTSALDETNSGLFLDLLFRELARQGTTLLLVSHDSRLADRFDRTVDMLSLQGEGRAEI